MVRYDISLHFKWWYHMFHSIFGCFQYKKWLPKNTKNLGNSELVEYLPPSSILCLTISLIRSRTTNMIITRAWKVCKQVYKKIKWKYLKLVQARHFFSKTRQLSVCVMQMERRQIWGLAGRRLLWSPHSIFAETWHCPPPRLLVTNALLVWFLF